jgi:hypothetical protein
VTNEVDVTEEGGVGAVGGLVGRGEVAFGRDGF